MHHLVKPMLTLGFLCAVAFGLIYPFAPIETDAKSGIVLLVLIAGLWFTEALPIPVTALLIPVFATLLGLGTLSETLAPFASPVVFLVFGGFVLSAALQKNGLDHWFSAITLKHCGGHTGKVLIGMFAITAFMSMWVSNASSTLMMLPIMHSILQRLPTENSLKTAAFGYLGLAYSSSLGGMMSLVGSPTNMIIAAQLDVDFFEWMMIVAPAALIFFPLMIAIMVWKLKPNLNSEIKVDLAIPVLTRKQKIVLAVFGATCVAWMNSSSIGQLVGIENHLDTWIILVAGALFVLLDLISWDDIEKNTQWGVLLLSGGGMALSGILQTSGGGEWLAYHVIDRVVAENPILFVIVVVFFLVFLTEMMSNAASAALTIPLLIISATSLNFPTYLLAPLVGVSASMAFMFPVATPPNAIVYGTGSVSMQQMISVGFKLNLAGVLFVVCYIMILNNIY